MKLFSLPIKGELVENSVVKDFLTTVTKRVMQGKKGDDAKYFILESVEE